MREWAWCVALGLCALGIAGCCSGSAAVTPPGPPVAPVVPLPPPPPRDPAAPAPAACVAFCQRLLACHLELGTSAHEGETDCTSACAPAGAYGGMRPESWACSERPECSDVWACSASDMAGQLVGSLAPPPSTGSLPEDWPEGFPSVPGGSAMRSPPMGPVHVAILAYSGRAPAELAEAYRAALVAAGWTIPEGGREHDEGADRFIATHGTTSVSVSVYREGAQTYVQTMQVGSLFPH
jgi:hypothetical protein